MAVSPPNPALVTQRAVRPLPRVALWLLCAAYVLPGLFGRDPWKNADVTAFGYMAAIAQGHTPWLSPTVGGLPADAALLPYWVGALSIQAFGAWLGPALAARLPFALLLVVVLLLTWYAAYHLARTEAAQPLPLAFGGEANPVDYARAIADGAVLALVACLGLLQLGHETTPELVQLAAAAGWAYALAAAPWRGAPARASALIALPALAASGAPSIAMALAALGVLICRASTYAGARRLLPWILVAAGVAALTATALGAWGWRVDRDWSMDTAQDLARLLVWFTWPAGPLALWTIWRWRSQLSDRHIAVALGGAAVSVLACAAMGGSDRALMLGLPSLAILAAFALPTLQRSSAAAIDWFSVCFFTIFAAVIWVVYVSIHTGVPAQPALNIERLSPGFPRQTSVLALTLATLASLAWLWLVRWRSGRSHHPLWKSLVLPASGVALCWLLVMTLLLPALDHARSDRSLVQRIARHVRAGACVAAPDVPRAQVAALEQFGALRVDARASATSSDCTYLLRLDHGGPSAAPPAPWRLLARERRQIRDDEVMTLYARTHDAAHR